MAATYFLIISTLFYIILKFIYALKKKKKRQSKSMVRGFSDKREICGDKTFSDVSLRAVNRRCLILILVRKHLLILSVQVHSSPPGLSGNERIFLCHCSVRFVLNYDLLFSNGCSDLIRRG